MTPFEAFSQSLRDAAESATAQYEYRGPIPPGGIMLGPFNSDKRDRDYERAELLTSIADAFDKLISTS